VRASLLILKKYGSNGFIMIQHVDFLASSGNTGTPKHPQKTLKVSQYSALARSG